MDVAGRLQLRLRPKIVLSDKTNITTAPSAFPGQEEKLLRTSIRLLDAIKQLVPAALKGLRILQRCRLHHGPGKVYHLSTPTKLTFALFLLNKFGIDKMFVPWFE